MYKPSTDLDDSAKLERRLADQLRSVNPTFDHTRVDLTPFQSLRAKIDCITISKSPVISKQDIEAMRAAGAGSRYTRPNDRPNTITIHDPSVSGLQFLIDHHPTAYIDYLEVAVDANLPEGSNDVYLLRQLKEQIRHCLAPQKHAQFDDGERLYWDITSGRRLHDAAAEVSPLTSVRYTSSRTGLDVNLYLKTLDQGNSYPITLRAELSLSKAAPGWAGIDRVSDLPAFAGKLRTYCSKAFFIGRGFKTGDVAGDKWRKYGASWELRKSKGLGIRPDAEANKRFGEALNHLGRSLAALKAA